MSDRSCFLVSMVLACCLPVGAASWPGPAEGEWQLTEVTGAPNAPAVILERTGHMFIDADYRSSFLDVYTRLKILTEEGTDYGSISIYSSDFFRTKNIEGRTHLPGGRVVELPKDATFEKRYSDYYGTSVLRSALPEVVEGSILEYRYRIYFDSVFYPRRWFFQADIPTLLSSITFDMPPGLRFTPVKAVTLRNKEMEESVTETVRGGQVVYTMRDMPAIPAEPAAFPFAAISSRVFMLPLTDNSRGNRTPLFESWERVCDLAWGSRRYGYNQALADRGAAKKKAKELGSARAIYEFVRDEIETEGYAGVWCAECSIDDVLSERKGDYAEKALLLYGMLEAIGVDSRIAWTCAKTADRVEPEIPNPAPLDNVLVALKTPEGHLFLEPSDRSVAYGALPPSLQGVPALLTSDKNPEWVLTPMVDAAGSAQDVTLELAVTEAGSVEGTGSMILTGNHAWRRLLWRETADETREGWVDWLEDQFPDFELSDVAVEESVAEMRVEVSWKLAQSDEDVLGDEVLIAPARPLALDSNPFSLAPERRLTPVLLSFPDTDRVNLRVTWPEGWIVDGTPPDVTRSNGAGSLTTSTKVDEPGRVADYHRELVISGAEFIGGQAYAELRTLYQAAVDADARTLLLILE